MPMTPGEITEVRATRRPELHALHAFSLQCPSCRVQVIYLHQRARSRRTCQRCRASFRFAEWVRAPFDFPETWTVRARMLGSRQVRSRRGRLAPRRDFTQAPVTQTGGPRRFGVELEIVSLSTTDSARALTGVGIPCSIESYGHTTLRTWKTVTDGSIGYQGSEVVSPILQGDGGLEQVGQVCEAITAAGGTIDTKCGMHVHLDARDLSPRQVCAFVRYFQRIEKVLDLFVAPSRRGERGGNGYACTLQNLDFSGCATLDDLRRAYHSERYHKLNVQSLFRQGSLEIRMHQGTTDGVKTKMWVRLMLALMDDVLNGTEATEVSVSGVLANKADDVKAFFTGRAAHFVGRMGRSRAAQVAAVAA